MTWAISPPIVPAPTTAALKTNMGGEATAWLRPPLPVGKPLAAKRSSVPESHRERSADEEDVGQPRSGPPVVELVVELRHDRSRPRPARTGPPGGRVICVVEDLGPRPRRSYSATRSVTRPRPAGPDCQTTFAPGSGQRRRPVDDVAEAVDERRPAVRVQPQVERRRRDAGRSRRARGAPSGVPVDLAEDPVERARQRAEEREHVAQPAARTRRGPASVIA